MGGAAGGAGMSADAIMVLGTSSGAGKSWITTAMCRALAQRGLRVAPFKAQNMSNNARVVASASGWGEIGSAQYFQALAAGATPHVDMNPVLLKPEADTRSQVVIGGRVDATLSAMPWGERSGLLWPHITAALDRLREQVDVVVIEGAGSPAEINLMDRDIVNLRVAQHADAACVLVSDIDRGGAFAHLYGTWALLPEADRARLRGFVFNKFRGDPSLLAPGPEQLQALTGVPLLATLPWFPHHGLPEEDWGWAAHGQSTGAVHTTVAIVCGPQISNLDEFQALHNVNGVQVRWARRPADVDGADWLLLPGSKDTLSDLRWLRQQGLDAAVHQHAARGGRILGICGGLQMLGEALIDDQHIQGNVPGLGLLPLVTRFLPTKTVQPCTTRFGRLHGAWQALSGLPLSGYEIHQGQTVPHPGLVAAGQAPREVLPGLAWQDASGQVLGLYVHGLFEDAQVVRALFGQGSQTLDGVFDALAAHWLSHGGEAALDALRQASAR
jgi:adenosylcobyric acid synthase